MILTTGAGESIILDSKLPHFKVPLKVVYISSDNFWKRTVTLDSDWILSGTSIEPSYPLRSISLWYKLFAKKVKRNKIRKLLFSKMQNYYKIY